MQNGYIWIQGTRYRIRVPSVPDPDHWVRLIPAPEKTKKLDKCAHSWSLFYNHMIDAAEGRRCTKCHKQEWF